MLGKILIILLLLLLLVLLVLMLLPLSVFVSYADGIFSARFCYASKIVVLYPPKTEAEDGQHDSKKKQRKSGKNKQKRKPQEKTAENKKPNLDQIIYSLDILPGVLLRALRHMTRKIKITPLKVHVLVASADPADTALLYGRLQGALDALLPQLHRKLRIDDQDIRLFPDFTGENMDCIIDVGIHIRPLGILTVAVFAAGGVLKWYMGYRKLAGQRNVSQNSKRDVAC